MRSASRIPIVLGLLSLPVATWHGEPAEAAPVARIAASGEQIEIEYSSGEKPIAKETIPLYRVGAARYFSVGVGVEEREASYPPFPLKLIFVAGTRAYLSHVSVTISDLNDSVVLRIPEEQVTGPWLFVDLPAGAYKITATRPGFPALREQVRIAKEGTKAVYFRWKEEPALRTAHGASHSSER